MIRKLHMTVGLFLLCFVFCSVLVNASDSATLTLLCPELGIDQNKEFEALIREFEQEQGIEVEVDWISWGAIVQTITTRTAAGMPPDVYMLGTAAAPSIASQGGAEDLKPFLGEWFEENKDDFYDVVFKATTYDDQVLAIPTTAVTYLLGYRKDLFAEAGLDPERPPQTWDELHEYAVKLAVSDGPIFDRAGVYVQTTYTTTRLRMNFHGIMSSFGGDIYNEDYSDVLFNSAAGIKAADFLRSLIADGGIPLIEMEKMGAMPRLADGSAAMDLEFAVGTARDILRYAPEMQEHVGLAYWPAGDTGRGGSLGGRSWYMGKGVKHPEEAWKLIEWLVRPENMVRFAELNGELPSRISLRDSDYVQNTWGMDLMVDSIEWSAPSPPAPHLLEVDRALCVELEAIFRGDRTVEEGLLRAEEDARAVIATYQ